MDEKGQTCDALLINGLRIESNDKTILLQETRLSGISREVGSLDKSGSKWGYYKGASFRSVYDILNHWSAQKEALCG